jgi:chromosome segregation ATPase
VNDPIQVHLLVETALGDSKEFEILSQEEVDDLKKQCQVLSQRIEQTRQNLAIQSKYRDAANSMAKLYSSSDKKKSVDGQDSKKGRRSLLGHNRNGSEQFQEAEQERIASERKCEELAADLWALEKRIMEPQSRLLKHTAGILQMTHKGPKKTRGQMSSQQNGIPGSPESMYTYSNSRRSIEPINDELFFDERSLYKPADRLDHFDEPEEKSRFAPKSQGKEQLQMIALTEQKLESLNSRLREVIVKVNPQREDSYGVPPLSKSGSDGRSVEPGDTLQRHLEYLEQGLVTINQEHNQTLQKHEEALKMQQLALNNQQESFRQQQESMRRELESTRSQEEASRSQQESEAAMEETLEELNNDLRDLLLQYDPNRPEPPPLTGGGLGDQLSYFQDSIGAIRAELARAATTTSKSMGNQDNLQQMETVMMGLWEIIRSGEEEERQRRQERRQTRSAQNLPPDEDDMSGDDESNLNEVFSLQAFSTKVQWLYAQATQSKEQKKVLKRQIKQQRELNSKSDAAKDADIVQRQEELERTKALLTRTEMDADEIRKQLSLVMERLDEARQQEGLREQARSNDESNAVRTVQAELEQRNEKISALEEELQDLQDDRAIANAEMQSKIAASEDKITTLTQELAAAAAAQTTFQATIDQKEKDVAAKEKELDDMNMEIARLQTEVTIARAELDGAYGSRSQRAAEVSSNPAIQKEIEDLTMKNMSLSAELANLREAPRASPDADAKMQTLKKELEETIEEYEQMTKASIEWEKEREQLEGMIDKLRDEREGLEAQLSDEKVRWLGMKSPGLDGPVPANTSTTVLKNEFKKMMRDTRAENAKILRVCLCPFRS